MSSILLVKYTKSSGSLKLQIEKYCCKNNKKSFSPTALGSLHWTKCASGLYYIV